MSTLSATQAATEALERFLSTLDQLGTKAANLPEIKAPGFGNVTSGDADRARAEWRQRLQDPQEIDALKRRLGLR